MEHEVFISFSFKDQPIAETVVNRLLNTYHISCWICTQDIRAGENYKKMIVKAINDAKVLLMIQSESSMHSTEVPKEVSIALNKNKIVIPFVIDDSELSEDLEYDLLTVQRVDARKPTLDERIEELARQICSAVGRPFEKDAEGASPSEKRRLLSTSSVMPKKVFCGRDDLLAEIDESFESGERVIFLHGIGGIGKTQIAKQYAKRYKDSYDVIIYATYGGSLQDIILSDSVFSLDPPLTRYTLEDGSKEDNSAFFARKLEAVKEASNERTLIILDNFDVEEDSALADIMDAKYRLLITTRCDYSRYYNTIKIGAIDSMDQLKDIFMQNYGGDDVERDSPELSELIELVNRHTYTVELLALHMENSGQTASQMIEAVKKEGILSLSEEVRGAEMKTNVAYENLLKMFKIFSLDEEERRVLTCLSLMPISGVNTHNFREWASLPSPKVIKGLESRSWVIRNTEGVALHPIIREVVKHEIPADTENCRELIDRFTQTILDKNAWNLRMSEKERYLVIARSILEQFKEITEDTEELYYHVQCLASFAFDIDYATELAFRLYDFQRANTGENSFKTTRAAFKIGWIYANGMQSTDLLMKALEWLDLSNALFEKLVLTTTDEISRHTMNKVTLVNVCLKLYAQTADERYFERASAVTESVVKQTAESFKPGDYHYGKVGGARMWQAIICIEKGRYEEALEHLDFALGIYEPMFGENNTDSASVLWRKGRALMRLERYDEAREALSKSAEGFAEFMGFYHPNTYSIYLELGNCLLALGDKVQAQEAFAQALKIAEKIYAPGAEQIARVKEKI